MACTAHLYGLPAEELSTTELETRDPAFHDEYQRQRTWGVDSLRLTNIGPQTTEAGPRAPLK
jgi:hypothetical protein